MDFNRTGNAKKAIITGLIIKVLTIVFPFIMRTIIIYTLGTLYLGLNSLFTSILNTLNLAELGVGSVLVFAMYRPVADDNKAEIRALLGIYRKIYYIIGIFVTVAGICIIPFLKNIINGPYPPDINIYIIYIMYLVSTVAGYFFMAYKGSILNAYQRVDIINIVSCAVSIFIYMIQIIALLIFHNYYIYIGALVFGAVTQNLIVAGIKEKKYPDLKPEGTIDKETKHMIAKKTGALMGHKLGDVVVNSIDNIFISFFLGLNLVAIYNNYFYVITALSGVFLMLTGGLNSIVGNYLIKKSSEESYKLFCILHYAISLTICFCCSCLLNMFQPFMLLWVGENYILSFSSVALFSLYFFAVKIRTIGLLFKDSAGMWEKDFLKPYIQIIIDLVLDIILLSTIGINGAIISTIACMIFGFFYEGHVVFKYCLNNKPYRYYLISLLYLIITALSCLVSFIICKNVLFDSNIIQLAFNFIISASVSVGLFFVSTHFLDESKNSIRFFKNRMRKKI